MARLGVFDVSRTDVDQSDSIALLRQLKSESSLGATHIQDARGGGSELVDERAQEVEAGRVRCGDVRHPGWLPDLVEIVGSGVHVLDEVFSWWRQLQGLMKQGPEPACQES